MIITVKGQRYEVTNWDEFSDKLLTRIGFSFENEVRAEIDKMKLVDSGRFRGSLNHEVKNGELVLTSNAPYAAALEYGTLEYFDRYDKETYPEPGYPSIPKKKELSPKERTKLPRGGQPFAPIRRVLYNQKKMDKVINNAFTGL